MTPEFASHHTEREKQKRRTVVFDLYGTLVEEEGGEIEGSTWLLTQLKEQGVRLFLYSAADSYKRIIEDIPAGWEELFDAIHGGELLPPSMRGPFKNIAELGYLLVDDSRMQREYVRKQGFYALDPYEGADALWEDTSAYGIPSGQMGEPRERRMLLEKILATIDEISHYGV